MKIIFLKGKLGCPLLIPYNEEPAILYANLFEYAIDMENMN